MFFYTSLFIASLIVALIALWLYNALVDIGKVVYQAILPSSKGNPTDHLKPEVVLRTTINDVPTPWGWGEHSKPSQAARTAKIAPSDSVPWGWPGNNSKIREHGRQYDLNGGAALTDPQPDQQAKSATGWPYREEKFDFAGKSYKVSRKATPKKTNLSKTGTPWGW